MRLPSRRILPPLLGGVLFLGFLQLAASGAEPPDPTVLIDQAVSQRWQAEKVTPAPVCDDAVFARRVYLDLAGRIPTPAEVDQFRSDMSTGKRAALVDRLLASPEYARHMRDVFDVVFMGRKPAEPRRRRGESAGSGFRGEWLAYLERQFAENRPWNGLVSELLLARPKSAADRGAVWFLYDRQDRYQEIAETVGPAVFGVQVQCAQCHNHPLAKEIKQAHYWGLVSFFNRGKNKMTPAGPRVAESAVGGFNNFADLSGQSSMAELSFLGAETIPEERPKEGEKQEDKPDLYLPVEEAAKDEPPVPRFSRRDALVEKVVAGNPLVARAAVNRFWALLMGRGLVHPVDKMDSQHPASHPELLDALAKDFEASGFDVKRLVRALVLSRPYQLEARPAAATPRVPGPELFAAGLEKPLTAEALYRSLLIAATGKTDAEDPELRTALVEVFPDVFPEENLSNLKQSMFLTNNPAVQRLVRPEGETTAARLAAIADPAARVREAFRIAYARTPDAEELKASLDYLAARSDRSQPATAQLWWALLAGSEFRFNH